MSTQQPEALRLAEDLDAYHTRSEHKEAAAELRRLHELNTELLEALIKADVILYSEGFHPDGSYRTPIRAVIAKATGEAK
jgi:hypothetical protein